VYADSGTPDGRHGGLNAGAECVFLVCVCGNGFTKTAHCILYSGM